MIFLNCPGFCVSYELCAILHVIIIITVLQPDAEKEISTVTREIEECDDHHMLAVHYCRRGRLAREVL